MDLELFHSHHLNDAERATFELLDATTGPLGEGYDDAEWRMLGIWAQTRLPLGWQCDDGVHLREVIREAANRPGWSRREMHLLWNAAATRMADQPIDYAELYRGPLAAAARMPYYERRATLTGTPTWLAQAWPSAWVSLREQVEALLAEPETDDPAELVRQAMWEEDPFATRLISAYAPRLAAPGVLPLLRHWTTATTANPSPRWLKRARDLLSADAAAVLRDVLSLLVTHREQSALQRHYYYDRTEIVYLNEFTSLALRGMVWTCELVDEPWVTALLGDVAVATGTGMGGSGSNSRSERLANAAIGVLARRGGLEVIAQLARVQAKVRKKAILARVDKTLEAVAVQTGMSPEQLLERTVPAFGLGPDGTRTEHGLRLSLDGTITYEGRKTIPKAVRQERADLLAELRATAKELKKALPAERFRIERALSTERIWRWSDVCEHYLDHPVTGPYSRALIWEILQGPAGLPVQVDGVWELTDPAGRRIQPDPGTPVKLWHPIFHTVDEVRAWRDHLLTLGLRQPFKQAFREIYLLTPAEERTHTYSNRFARHILRYGQAKALLTERGWTGVSLGHWDAAGCSGQCQAVKELAGWTIEWSMSVCSDAESDNWRTVSACVTDRIRFLRGGESAPLSEVPPLVLSEALRDADLAVGVTSTGLDPEGHGDYWHSYSFGPLTETAQVRHDALTRLLPRLAIAARCTLTDRFLQVRGDLRTYRIHLGSGNILMDPNDAYLCIVPHHTTDPLFLPFEENGGTLSIILSKAFLLAADTTITDPSITRQIHM